MAYNHPYDPYQQQQGAPLAVSGYPTAPQGYGGQQQHRPQQQPNQQQQRPPNQQQQPNHQPPQQQGQGPHANGYPPQWAGQQMPHQNMQQPQQYGQQQYMQPNMYAQQYQRMPNQGQPNYQMGGHGQQQRHGGSKRDNVGKEEPGNKVFVGNFPTTWTELELRQVLAEQGQLTELTILLDRNTGGSRGCAFASFTTRESVERAVADLDGKRTIQGMTSPMKVKLVTAKTGDANKLFVGLLDRNMSEAELKTMFLPYGEVEQSTILRTPAGASRGCGFILMSTAHESQAAIAALHESITLPGNVYPMVVKFADTDKQKQAKKAMNQMPPQPQQPQNGWYGYPPVQGMYGQQMPMPMPQYMAPPVSGGADAGPEGGNLFIYHLPQDWTDAMLMQAFSPFGRIVSAKVFVDKATGLSKGFGFVSYDNAPSASTAIQAMNGYQVGNKRLKVQYKKPRAPKSY